MTVTTMQKSVSLSRRRLRETALHTMQHELGLTYTGTRTLRGTKIQFDEFHTSFGPRSFSILTRNYNSSHRYPLGFRPELLKRVDEFAICLAGEPFMYVIPQRILLGIYRCTHQPTINAGGQWFCNLNHQAGELESKGLFDHVDIRRFAVRIERQDAD